MEIGFVMIGRPCLLKVQSQNPKSKVQSRKSKVQSLRSKVESQKRSKVEDPTLKALRPSTLDLGPWTLDFGPWTLDFGLSTLDLGLSTLDFSRFHSFSELVKYAFIMVGAEVSYVWRNKGFDAVPESRKLCGGLAHQGHGNGHSGQC